MTPASEEGIVTEQSLTVRDNRTGKDFDLAITDGTIRAADLKQISASDGDGGLATYDPGFVNTASCRSLRHLHRRRQGHPGVPRIPDRAARRAVELPRGGLPAGERHAAEQGGVRGLGARRDVSHVRAREPEDLHAGLPLRRAPDGHAARLGRRAVHLLPRVAQHLRRGVPGAADPAADREDADARRVRVPARPGQAVRVPGQRAQLHGELPVDAVQDERAQVRRRRPPGAGAGDPVHPARRPRAERLHQRGPGDRLHPGRPVHARSPAASARSTARCTAAPTRRC